MIRLSLVTLISVALSAPGVALAKSTSVEPATMPRTVTRQVAEAGADPQAILDAVDVCDAWMATAENNGLDELTPYQQAISDAVGAISKLYVDARTHVVEDRAAYRALNGAPEVWLNEGHAGCSLNPAEVGGRTLPVLDTLRPGVLALLGAEGSGWSLEGENRWVRYDGWSLSLGDTAEPGVWGIERTR